MKQLRQNNDGRWDFLGGVLPYRINPTDIDLLMERNKRFLVLSKDDADTNHGTQKPLECMRRQESTWPTGRSNGALGRRSIRSSRHVRPSSLTWPSPALVVAGRHEGQEDE
jgi:hypothetical protein